MKKSSYILYIFFLFPSLILGQNMDVDADLLLNRNKEHHYSYYDENQGNDVKFMKKGKNTFSRYNPLGLILKPFMYLYQNGISPQLLSHCQHEMTCSNFSKNVISEYGFIKGIFLTSDRLMRDNSYCVSEYPEYKVSYNNKGLDRVHDFRMK